MMRTEWDYTELADAYVKRPDYSADAIDKMLDTAGIKAGMKICDVGAGAAHLTIMFAARGMSVSAVEPNDAMRAHGIERTSKYDDVKWYEGVGEHTGMPDGTFDMVTFGSSFNVCDRLQALIETKRISKPCGWFACMWNHRDLDDPTQRGIEDICKKNIPNWSYGSRREDQTDVIDASGLFGPVITIEGRVEHIVGTEDFIEGWRSHGTLQRQAGNTFSHIVDQIAEFIRSREGDKMIVSYTTRIWMAKLK